MVTASVTSGAQRIGGNTNFTMPGKCAAAVSRNGTISAATRRAAPAL
jgi:hypothetical protein